MSTAKPNLPFPAAIPGNGGYNVILLKYKNNLVYLQSMSNLNHKLLVLFYYKNRYPPLKQCKLVEIKNMVKRVVKDFAKDTSAQITTQLLSIEMEFEKLNDWKAYSVLDLSIFTAYYSEQRIGFCLRTALNY